MTILIFLKACLMTGFFYSAKQLNYKIKLVFISQPVYKYA